MAKTLTVPEQHMLKIAQASMRYSCTMLKVAGGPDHHDAAMTIESFTGRAYRLPQGCTCKEMR